MMPTWFPVACGSGAARTDAATEARRTSRGVELTAGGTARHHARPATPPQPRLRRAPRPPCRPALRLPAVASHHVSLTACLPSGQGRTSRDWRALLPPEAARGRSWPGCPSPDGRRGAQTASVAPAAAGGQVLAGCGGSLGGRRTWRFDGTPGQASQWHSPGERTYSCSNAERSRGTGGCDETAIAPAARWWCGFRPPVQRAGTGSPASPGPAQWLIQPVHSARRAAHGHRPGAPDPCRAGARWRPLLAGAVLTALGVVLRGGAAGRRFHSRGHVPLVRPAHRSQPRRGPESGALELRREPAGYATPAQRRDLEANSLTGTRTASPARYVTSSPVKPWRPTPAASSRTKKTRYENALSLQFPPWNDRSVQNPNCPESAVAESSRAAGFIPAVFDAWTGRTEPGRRVAC